MDALPDQASKITRSPLWDMFTPSLIIKLFAILVLIGLQVPLKDIVLAVMP